MNNLYFWSYSRKFIFIYTFIGWYKRIEDCIKDPDCRSSICFHKEEEEEELMLHCKENQCPNPSLDIILHGEGPYARASFCMKVTHSMDKKTWTTLGFRNRCSLASWWLWLPFLKIYVETALQLAWMINQDYYTISDYNFKS